MTAREMTPAIGQTVLIKCEDLQVPCIVHDVKTSYGTVRIQIEPVAGHGTQWVSMTRVAKIASSLAVSK